MGDRDEDVVRELVGWGACLLGGAARWVGFAIGSWCAVGDDEVVGVVAVVLYWLWGRGEGQGGKLMAIWFN